MKRFGLFLLLYLVATVGWTQESKPELKKISTNDDTKFIQNWVLGMYVRNNGYSAHDDQTGNSGLFYPVGEPTALVFQDGMVWGGHVQDKEGGNPRLSAGGATYRGGLQAGPILTPGVLEDGQYQPPIADSAHYPQHRIYQLQWNWQDLPDTDPNKAAFAKDYQEWPVQYGAPTNSDGSPKLDGYQILYYVSNDMDQSRTNFLYGSNPIGLEVQHTFIAPLRFPTINYIVYKKKIINKSGLMISDFYISIWSDIDMGNAGDDLIGVDTILQLGFCYNGDNNDEGGGGYNRDIPSVGYLLLQGPSVDGLPTDSGRSEGRWFQGKRNLTMSSFSYYIGGGPQYLEDPSLGDYQGTITLYNYMRGLNANGDPQKNGRNEDSLFPYAGDPLDPNADDLDGILFPPDDRRIMMNMGPVEFPTWQDLNQNGRADPEEPGVLEVVYAVVVGDKGDRLLSLGDLKEQVGLVKRAYLQDFANARDMPSPQLTIENQDATVTLQWDDTFNLQEVEGYQSFEYQFQGYKVYQLADSDTKMEDAILLETFDVIDGITTVSDRYLDATDNEFIKRIFHVGSDTGIVRDMVIDWDYINDEPLVNNKTYYFGISAYSVFHDTLTGWTPDSLLAAGGWGTQYESKMTVVEVRPFKPAFDDPDQVQSDLKRINVFPNPFYSDAAGRVPGMTFSNLPADKTRIRIFTMSGTFIRDIRHENGTQFELWDLTNESGQTVAAGMYLAYVETDFGIRVLKLAVVPMGYELIGE